MKILLFSDVHLHKWLNFGVNNSGISIRLLVQRNVLQRVYEIGVERNVDLVIFGGDWVHKVGEHSTEVLSITKSVLEDSRLPHLFVEGNHDIIRKINPHKYHRFIEVIKPYVKLVDLDGLGIKIKLINYYDAFSYEAIEGYDLVVLHKQPTVINRYGHYFDGVDWKRLSENNRMVIFGHYHIPMKLAHNCYVLGAPLQLGFGDEGDRGVWILDSSKDSIEFVGISSPKFFTVDKEEDITDDNYYRLLDVEKRVEKSNVVSVIKPKYFDERIKADKFEDILNEWLKINNKDIIYLDCIKDIITDKLVLGKNIFKGRVSKITIKDFLSVRDVEYSVQNGFTLVCGQSDTFDSNGSGKSTIVGEALFWGLFGRTTKGLTGDDVVRRGYKDCIVTVVLDCNDEKQGCYEVVRSRKKGIEVKYIDKINDTFKDLTVGLRQVESQNILESILGFDEKVFLASCYFSQEQLLMLTGLDDTDKTNMITALLGFEVYDDLYNKVHKQIGKLQGDISQKERERAEVERNATIVRAEQENFNANVISIKDDIARLNYNISKEQEEIGKVTEVMGKVILSRDFSDVLEKCKRKESIYESDLFTMDKNIDNSFNQHRSLSSKESEILTEIRCIQMDIDKIKKNIEDIQSMKIEGRCNYCGAVIEKNSIDEYIKEKLVVLNEGELKVKNLALLKVEILEKIRNAIEVVNRYKKEKKRLQDKLFEIKKEQQSILLEREKYNKELKEDEVRVEKIKSMVEEKSKSIERIKDMIISQESKLESYNKKIVEIVEKINEYTYNVKEISLVIEEIQVEIETLEFWKIAFSAKGIRAVLLDRFCNEINSVISGYLSQISNGNVSLIISPTKLTKAGEERNKIELEVSLDGNSAKYKSLSGGEKRRVDISLCFGLNRWVSDKYGIKNGLLGLVILDEVFGFLDRTGEETLSQLLYEEGVGRAIFVIDHALDLSSYADRIFTVVKSDGVSRLIEEEVV